MSGESDVQVVFGAQIAGVVAGVNQVKEQIETLNGSVSGITDAFKGVGEALAGLFAVEKIEQFTEHMSEMGEQAIRTSEMLGMSVEKVQELSFASQMVGGGADGAAASLTRLERNMAEAQSGTGKAYEAFQNLGISLDDLKTKSPDQILGMIADAFAGAEDGATKTAYAMDLMGRAGAQLIPLLDQGSEGLERMGMIGRETGSILSGEQAEAFEKTHQSLSTMNASFTGVAVTLFDTFRPAIDAIVGGITDLVQCFNESIKSGGQLHPVIMLLAVAFDGLVMGIESGVAAIRTTIEGVELALYDLLILVNTIVDAVKDLFSGLGAAISDALHGRFDQIEVDFKKGVDQMKVDWQAGMNEMNHAAGTFADDVISTWAALQKRANEMWQGLTGTGGQAAEKGGKKDLPPAPTGAGGSANTGESEEMQIEKNDLVTQEELANIGLQIKKDALDQQVADHAISKQQELAQEISLVQQKEQIELEAVTKYAALYEEDTVQYAEAQNKKKIITAQANQEIAKLTAQSASEQKKEYDTIFQSIERASSQAVNGILQGTQTWQQALQRTFSNILAAFVDDLVVKRVTKWLEGEAIMLTGTQAKNAGVMASDAAANDAGLAGMAIKAIKAIMSDAAQTFGGVFAFLAPEMGPAAAGPAAGAAAAVSAAASSIPSFAVGSWNLPSDMLAYVHAGEMIVPAAQAAGLRDGGGFPSSGGSNGADSYHITIQAIDTQTGAQFLKQNAGVIAQSLSGQMRNFNKNLRT